MACFRPITAWKPDEGGKLLFRERKNTREIQIPCGQCIGCRLERSRQWAIRCMHEAQMHPANSFLTLTYSDEHVPSTMSLDYRDFQLFMKRLRKRFGSVRFYMCGEYGEQFLRPHFHACLFGLDFPDKVWHHRVPSGFDIYTSKELQALWPFGFSSIGDVTFESAAYVARYVTKKVTGARAAAHYSYVDLSTGELVQRTPEFTRMSLKAPRDSLPNTPGGIGGPWIKRYTSDVYTTDKVIVRGVECKPPRYYDNFLKSTDPFASEYLEFLRYSKVKECAEHNTPGRLAAREQVAAARLNLKKRSLE